MKECQTEDGHLSTGLGRPKQLSVYSGQHWAPEHRACGSVGYLGYCGSASHPFPTSTRKSVSTVTTALQQRTPLTSASKRGSW